MIQAYLIFAGAQAVIITFSYSGMQGIEARTAEREELDMEDEKLV